ncbi:shikimate kinase [Rhodococcus oxybenzonivorans]|uniref:shikimate kinase n=1 Tax=Rhodococcus TaxID=1827 RepID=UPI00131F87EA|nr:MULTISPECIES: shikimate kinase [Rhodococcus]MDV7351895.1 shikimate kinase [Rhodococcus oxybenzonivorans]QHE69784.1 Shikimate kinase I [Rhodococcus sp. WAY2]
MAPKAVLVGPPGAGKSTIGRRLAQALDLPLFDTDAAVEEEAGRTIAEIFVEDGEPAFRALEEEIVRKAIESSEGIVSLGGGSILSERTRALLKGHTVIYLEISVGEGLKRTGTSTARPLLAGGDPREKYAELMRRRRPLYREVASIRIRTDGRSPARVVQQLVAKLAG